MDKETAEKFEKDLSVLLEKYGMKKNGSELRHGFHITIPKQIDDVFFITHNLEFYELINH